MKPKKRLPPNERRDAILAAAVDLSRRDGYNQITRDAIAEHAGVSMGLVTRYFGTMNKMRRAIIRAAISDEVLEVIAQGLAARDEHARKAPDDLKRKALATLAE